jgi:predicted nucleotidyltransferase
MKNEEQIVRMAKLFGNGAHIFVPKEWIGEQIVLIKPQKKTLKEKIIEVLDPYLESIVGVYLYGSHARLEQVEDSDIDMLIITDKKIKIRKERFEIICLEQKDIANAIKLEPLLMHSIFAEAKTIINSKLLDEFKIKYTPKLSDFTKFFEDCDRLIKINRDSLDSEKNKYVSGEAVIYSLMLRLRGLFIVKSVLSQEKYTYSNFKKWVCKNLPEIDFESIYEAYRSSKNEKKIRQKVEVNNLKVLLEFLNMELDILKYGKKREKA